jgi:hypothetical protein
MHMGYCGRPTGRTFQKISDPGYTNPSNFKEFSSTVSSRRERPIKLSRVEGSRWKPDILQVTAPDGQPRVGNAS